MKKSIILLILSSLALYSCINLKSDYPQIQYYKLSQQPLSDIDSPIIEEIIQLRDFSISPEYNTDQIIAVSDTHFVKVYYYSRWAANPDEIVQGIFYERINNYGIFSSGVQNTSSITLPNYFVECSIIEFYAVNGEDDDSPDNAVVVTMKMNVIKKTILKTEDDIILSKIYKTTVGRQDNYAASVSSAMSKAVCEVSDMMIKDIVDAIKKN